MDKSDQYFDILMHFLPKYTNTQHANNKKKERIFVPESKVIIAGIFEYKPYNPTAIKQFHKLIRN